MPSKEPKDFPTLTRDNPKLLSQYVKSRIAEFPVGKAKDKVHRLSSYEPDEYPRMAYIACAELGAKDEELAALFDVSLITVARWKESFPDFGMAVQEGKDRFDSTNIEKRMVQKIMGYEITEVTREPRLVLVKEEDKKKKNGKKSNGKNGKNGKVLKVKGREIKAILKDEMVVVKEVTKHVPPDGHLMTFWLHNRSKGRWLLPQGSFKAHIKHDHRHAHAHLHQHNFNLEDFSDEELKILDKLMEKFIDTNKDPDALPGVD